MHKIRTVIVIDHEVDAHGMSIEELCALTDKQLKTGELYVDDYMEHADNVIIATIPVNSEDND